MSLDLKDLNYSEQKRKMTLLIKTTINGLLSDHSQLVTCHSYPTRFLSLKMRSDLPCHVSLHDCLVLSDINNTTTTLLHTLDNFIDQNLLLRLHNLLPPSSAQQSFAHSKITHIQRRLCRQPTNKQHTPQRPAITELHRSEFSQSHPPKPKRREIRIQM